MKQKKWIGWGLVGVLMLAGMTTFGGEDTNIVSAVKADESAGWESVFTPSNQIPFYINLYKDHGFYFELVESSSHDGVIANSIFSNKRRLTGRLGALLFLDGALYHQTGNLPDEGSAFYVRKLRVNTYGRAFFLSPLTYGLEFGVADRSFYFNDGYLWFHQVPWVSSVKAGVFSTPMSMQSLESSSSSPMMEEAAPVSTFAPGDKLGLQLGGPLPGERATFYTGVFSDAVSSENSVSAKRAYRYMARGTWLPIYGTGTNSMARVIHLGASCSYVYSAQNNFQFRARPESYKAPYMIDTGELSVETTLISGLEAASQTGPLLLQSELFVSKVGNVEVSSGGFWGAYATASLMLTGETRGYNRSAGYFTGITPKRKFNLREGSWGALEWASQLSYTDLTSGSVRGGTMGIVSTGINCYLSASNRLMLDGGAARIKDSPNPGDFYFIQCRLQIQL